MTENKENWLYSDASGLYFVHDGFIMRATDGKQYDIEEECDLLNELSDKIVQLNDENEQLKKEVNDTNLANTILQERNKQYKEEIKDFQDILANKEEELLKPIIRMIDDKIIECEQAVEEIRTGERDSYIVKHDVASKILKELKKELNGDVE